MTQTVVLKVAMSCGGCSGAVQRALGKMEGVDSIDINMKEQKVTVTGNVQPETVFETVSKTGKKTSFWEEPVPAPAPAAATETAPAPTNETDPAPATATETAPAPAAEAAPAPAAEAAPAPALETAPPAAEVKPAESVSTV